jgi:hypothetical protein
MIIGAKTTDHAQQSYFSDRHLTFSYPEKPTLRTHPPLNGNAFRLAGKSGQFEPKINPPETPDHRPL